MAAIYDENQELLVPERQLDYDILVMALGSKSNDFGTPGIKEHCIFLDSPQQAHRFHNEMLNLFLKYSADSNAEAENRKVNIAIVGVVQLEWNYLPNYTMLFANSIVMV